MNLHLLPTLEQLATEAAIYVARLSAEAVTARGRFMVALSGGSLPKLLCPALVAEPLRTQINWSAWHIFWADERCVPLTDPDSNYYLAQMYLFDHVQIPPTQIYAPNTSLLPSETARAYQETLHRAFFQSTLAKSDSHPFTPSPSHPHTSPSLPRFDLILLGMGEDGHTASLFPHHPLLQETERWVAPVFDSPKPPPRRITLTLPVLNHARHVAFLAAGAGKAEILREVLETEAPPGALPAQMVRPTGGEVHWFVDEAAAARLSQD